MSKTKLKMSGSTTVRPSKAEIKRQELNGLKLVERPAIVTFNRKDYTNAEWGAFCRGKNVLPSMAAHILKRFGLLSQEKKSYTFQKVK